MNYNELTERDLYMYRRGELREYIRNHRPLSIEIQHELRLWVDAGHSVYENPWKMYIIECGFELGYLEAKERFFSEKKQKENYKKKK